VLGYQCALAPEELPLLFFPQTLQTRAVAFSCRAQTSSPKARNVGAGEKPESMQRERPHPERSEGSLFARQSPTIYVSQGK